MLPFERKGCSKYGANMGEASQFPFVGKVYLRRVPLDMGGYDKGGAYWGSGQPLYCAWGDDGGLHYLRASSRDEAKQKLLARFPTLTFKR